ncbi:MAG: hypothetical protein RQ966_07135, partial [Acetobacteraceae bacterium]|nr:hypothetical protein [Acetobacteraceae bacterium]
WASGDTSTFTGTGGPAAFDPFTSEFAGLVSSSGLTSEAFQDEVYSVDAGDQVTFVIALQNFGTVPAYNVKLRDTLPLGFTIANFDLTVVDGAGNDLAFSGNLFSPGGGLTITSPIGAFDNSSGANVVLVTFTATATNAISLPGATVTNNAQIVSYAASSGGANLAGSSVTSLSASTPVQTGKLSAISVADQPAAPLLAGQTASFDITVTLPEGSVGDLRIDEVLPQIGTSWLQLISAQIMSVGSNLTPSAPLIVQPNGSIQLGTVVNAYDNLVTAADQIVVRVTVHGAGTTAGSGTINTVVSTADPNNAGARISTTLSNTVALGPANAPPTISGTSTAQFATTTSVVLPFRTITLTDPDVAQIQTFTIHLSDPTLGTLSSTSGLLTRSAGDYVLTGTAASVQAAAQALLFTPSTQPGVETFTLTLDDGAFGVATSQETLTVAAAAHPSSLVQFPISPQTVLTSSATGTSTYSQVQLYQGAIGNLNTQYLYDGDTALAIVAQQSGMLISSQAQQTAVQLQGGTNVLDMKQGSSFLVSGTGSDTFLLHVDQAQTTWNTISNFHTGDSVILYGFTAGTSVRWLDASAGAASYTGATLRLDVDGNGTIDSSLTFANKTASEVEHYSYQTGTVGGASYLSIVAA